MAWIIDPDTGMLVQSAGSSESGGGGSSGGGDLSFVTAGASDILAGKVGADTAGNPVYGTLQPGGGGSSGGGDIDFYKCASYDDGKTIPAYSNLTLSGITSHAAANGDYIALDITAEGTDRKWSNEDYTIASKAGVWYIYPSTVTPNKMTALYYAEVLPATTGEGTVENPKYWDSVITDTENRWVTPIYNTGDYGNSGNKCNFYVKLTAGTPYQMGVSANGQDNVVRLYNLAGEVLIEDDGNSTDINGVSCSDAFTYTPATTGIYRFEAGAWSSAVGDVQAVCYPAPEFAEAPTVTEPWEIEWTAGGAEEGAYIITAAGYAPAIGEYTPSTETFDSTTVWTNKDTGAVWKAGTSGSNWRWYLYPDATGSSYIYYEDNYHQSATPWDVVSPNYITGATKYDPAPTLARGTGKTAGTLTVNRVDIAERPATGKQVWTGYKATQSEESQKWVFSDALTSNLEVKGAVPIVGRIYSADTTVQVENVVEDMPGRMLCLAHFDGFTHNTAPTFVDATETCIIQVQSQASVMSDKAKFGNGSWYGNYQNPEYPNGGFTVISLPAIDGDFTVEFWHYHSGYTDNGGLILYISKWDADNWEYEKIAELNAVKLATTHPQYRKGIWFHHAFVRHGSTVTEYIDGVKVNTSEFTATLGGEFKLYVYGGGRTGDVRNNIDEFAIFDYARYTSNFVPPYAPYPDIPSGVRTPNTDIRQVSVSGVKSIPWANSKSYALVDSSATGNSRVWVTSDGKWYIWFDEGNSMGWVLANSTSFDEPDYIEVAYISGVEDQYGINPIGHPGWIDAVTKTKIKVTAN